MLCRTEKGDEIHATVGLEKMRLIWSVVEDTRAALVVGSGKPDWRRMVALSRR